MMTMAPASFAGCTFHAIHAFRVTAPDGTERLVRYHWIPRQESETLTDEETRALGKDYLRAELERRLEAGPIAWDLQLQIGEDGDDPNDPTTAWPDDRQHVIIGTMTLTEFAGHECDPMIFDPGRVIDGIERSDDPILHARSDAYSVSFARRTSS
jgi:catalase